MKKIGYILGRRIRGDVILGNDPITNAPGRLLAPAVPITGQDQFYDEESATPNYDLGSRMVVDERRYHYCLAGAAIVMPGTYRLAITQDISIAANTLASVAPIVTVGQSVVVVAVGAFQGGAVVANELVGGWIMVMPTGNVLMWRRIIANTVVAAGNFTITVDRPFTTQIEIGDEVEVHPSIYRDVRTATGVLPQRPGFMTPVCLPPIEVQNGYYFWGQSYGPCWIAPSGPMARNAAHLEDVYFWSNGCYALLSDFGGFVDVGTGIANISPLRIGHVLPMGELGGPGSNMINLQLAP